MNLLKVSVKIMKKWFQHHQPPWEEAAMGPEGFVAICRHWSYVWILDLCGYYIQILNVMLLRCPYRGRKYDDFKCCGLPNYSGEIWSDRWNNSWKQPLVRALWKPFRVWRAHSLQSRGKAPPNTAALGFPKSHNHWNYVKAGHLRQRHLLCHIFGPKI